MVDDSWVLPLIGPGADGYGDDMQKRNPTPVIVGALMIVVCVIWLFQGLGAIAGSFMTNVPFWSFAGGAVAVVGVVLLVRGLRAGRRG